jgi:exosortase
MPASDTSNIASDHGSAPSGKPLRYDYVASLQSEKSPKNELPGYVLAIIAGLGIFFYLLYRINFEQLVHVWSTNPNFSQGFLIPVISAMFIYLRWNTLRNLPVKPAYVGLLLLAFGVFGQVLFRITGQEQFSDLSMLVVLFGLGLWLLGWQQMKILWLPICYLLFMINPPQALYVKLTTPLQSIAASGGAHMLLLFGIHAYREATQIHLQVGDKWPSLNVAQACSGIRMLTAFFALAVALAYSTNRPMWQKLMLSLCALPIAIFVNALRVTLSGVLFAYAGSEWARGSTHASLGLLMLIPAGLLQLGAAKLIDLFEENLFVDDLEHHGHAEQGAKA